MTNEDLRDRIQDGRLRNRLYLVTRGVPYAIAVAMTDAEALAHIIIFGEIDGNVWDWGNMEWIEHSPHNPMR